MAQVALFGDSKKDRIITRDFYFTFILFSSAAFAAQLGQLTVILPVIGFALYVAAYPRHVFNTLRRQLLLLVIPALAFVSILWSRYPGETFYYSVQYAFTICAALLIGGARDKYAVIYAIFTGYGLNLVVSAAFGGYTTWGAHGGMAFTGLAAGKNFFGDTAAMAALGAIAVGLHAYRQGSLAWMAAAGIVLAISLVILPRTQASGPLMALGIGTAVLVSTYASGHWPGYVKTLCVLNLLLFGSFILFQWDEIVSSLLGVFNKDSTLTGRTYIWYRATFVIEQNPLLGTGFNGFWVHGNPDAEALWAVGGILSRRGFNFHNTYIEVLVTFGAVGCAIFFPILLWRALQLLRRYLRTPGIAECYWIAIIAIEFARFPLESLGLVQFAAITVLIFAALSFSTTAQTAPGYRMLWRRPGPRTTLRYSTAGRC